MWKSYRESATSLPDYLDVNILVNEKKKTVITDRENTVVRVAPCH